jgi:hypothetical protein
MLWGIAQRSPRARHNFVEPSLRTTYEDHLDPEDRRGGLVVAFIAVAKGVVGECLAVLKSPSTEGVAGLKHPHNHVKVSLSARLGQALQRVEFMLDGLDVPEFPQMVGQPFVRDRPKSRLSELVGEVYELPGCREGFVHDVRAMGYQSCDAAARFAACSRLTAPAPAP